MNNYIYQKIKPIRELVRRYLGLPSKEYQDILDSNLKEVANVLAIEKKNQLINKYENVNLPHNIGLISKACTQNDIESEWFSYWCKELKFKPLYLRKLWEYAFILQVLHENNLIKPLNKAICFGCGTEPLPSYLASKGLKIFATDLDPDLDKAKMWKYGNQLLENKKLLFKPNLIDEKTFNDNVSISYIDMNNIPDIKNEYDICYSICALEHLGSIQNGLNFIVNSLKVLKKGGLAIHTTEYNYRQENNTIDNRETVLFLKKHFIEIAQKIENNGDYVFKFNFDIGNEFFDKYIDLPPYLLTNYHDNVNNKEPHLKLLLEKYPSTCFGIIIKKQ
ncbi:MAG: methyltransferase domain-containing protein [Alphaproteobacteria bacterium]|nr:methyltransferase domain-containing protein [Alphaproteobacteria bacterium]